MAVDGLPETVEELTITRSGDERMADRNELEKKVVTSGAWATVIYKFQEKKVTKKDGETWTEKYSLVRYRKLKGTYKFQKEFAISNSDHVKIIRDTFTEWLAKEAAPLPAGEPPAEAPPADDA